MGFVKVTPKEIRDEILAKVKAGERVAALVKQYGLSDRIIYGWLHKTTGEGTVSI